MPPPPRRGPPGRLADAGAPASIDGSGAALGKAIAAGRSSGVINLSARGLSEVPAAVYDPDAPTGGDGGGAWWEAAELTKLDVSRNEVRRCALHAALRAACGAARCMLLHWHARSRVAAFACCCCMLPDSPRIVAGS